MNYLFDEHAVSAKDDCDARLDSRVSDWFTCICRGRNNQGGVKNEVCGVKINTKRRWPALPINKMIEATKKRLTNGKQEQIDQTMKCHANNYIGEDQA